MDRHHAINAIWPLFPVIVEHRLTFAGATQGSRTTAYLFTDHNPVSPNCGNTFVVLPEELHRDGLLARLEAEKAKFAAATAHDTH